MTPREVFNLMKDEGFLVDYARLPGKLKEIQHPIHKRRDGLDTPSIFQ
jgi:hypothetical protein